MAKGKNEILLSIALEGDQDVKSKLQAVGDASKKSIGNIEKSLGDVGKSGFGGLGETAGKLSEALAPLTEASGLAGLAGLSGLTGIFGRLAAGPAGIIAGIAGVVLGMAKIGEETDKAKLKLKALGASGDTFEKLNKTAKELGVSTEDLQPSFEKFAASKNKINADRTSGVVRLRPSGATEADEAAAGVRIIGGGGKETGAPVPDNVFIGAMKTLIEGAQAEKIPGDQAGKIADAFSSKVQTERKLTPEAVDTLNPASQNILAKSLSSFFGRDLLNGAEIKEQLARPGQRAPSDNEVFRSLNAAEPDAHKQAESAYGLTAAFDALLAATKHLAEEFSGDVGIADAIKKIVNVINDAADNADKVIHPRDYEPGGPKFIGPVSPAENAEYKKPDVVDLGKTLLTGKSDPRFGDSNAVKVMKFLRDGPESLQQTTPEDVFNAINHGTEQSQPAPVGDASAPLSPVTEQLANNPAILGIQQRALAADRARAEFERREKGLKEIQDRGVFLEREGGGFLIAPDRAEPQPKQQPAIPPGFERLEDGTVVKSSPSTAPPVAAPGVDFQYIPPPSPVEQRRLDQDRLGGPPPQVQPTPAQTQPVLPPQQFGQVDQSFQTAGLASTIGDALRSLVQGITDKANGLAPAPDNKVQGQVDGLGIRGEGSPPPGTSVGDASQSITDAGAKLAAALDGVTALIGSVQSSSPVKVQVAATGGAIRHLDDGGHLSGPGTSTSDSIPAMLSDGEYVIKASSARKLGRSHLDWLNAGAPGMATGGDVMTARRLAKVKRFAAGGDASGDNGVSRSVASQASLGPGDHEITFDPQTGGAFVDGTLHLPGDPLLDDPTVQRGIAQSKAGMSAQPSNRKYKSDFVGRFGHSDDSDTYVAAGGPIGDWGRYAGGGAIGDIPNISRFAAGGSVSIARMLHLAEGGGVSGMAGPPTLDVGALAAPGGSTGHLDVDLRTNHGDFKMMAPEDVARQMSRAAGDAALAQTGPRPRWFKGQ